MTQTALNNAKVLFRLSVKRDEVERSERLLQLTPELLNILTSPIIPQKSKHEVIERVFAADSFEKVFVDYMKKMSDIGELNEILDIFKTYYLYWDKMNRIIRADLITAIEADSQQIQNAKTRLNNKYPGSTIILTPKVDKSIIGGYIIRLLHEEYDDSFEGKLRQLEEQITGR